MSKPKVSLVTKAKNVVLKYPKEFIIDSHNNLYCKTCKVTVKCDKEYYVETHRSSQKHTRLSGSMVNQPKLVAEKEVQGIGFPERVTKAFLSANIALKKLQNKELKSLFLSMGHPLPSETTCRNQVEKIYMQQIEKIKKIIEGKQVFVVFDESSIRLDAYANILIGAIDKPEISYLVECKALTANLNAAGVCQIINDVLTNMNIARENFALFLSDAARYMTAAFSGLKMFYPNLVHVTCLAHLLHNCCMRIRGYFQDVDQLISSIKAATIKNKERRALFKEMNIDFPPEPVLTRWGSWLNAALYYSENLVKVKAIFDKIEGNGILVKNAKKALESPTLVKSICSISSNYKCLSDKVSQLESSTLGIKEAFKKVTELEFGDDLVGINDYIQKRLDKNGIREIVEMSDPNISPDTYAKLQDCQATSCCVERSFSMLSKLLEKDRNFKREN